MGRVKVIEVDRNAGTIKVKYGQNGINLPILPEVEDELRRKHSVLAPGVWIDHPGISFGGAKPTHRRKRRKHYDRVVPTQSERSHRRWGKRNMKITIEWQLKPKVVEGTEDAEERTLTPEQVLSLETSIGEFVLIPGMEETVKTMVEALKKAREPVKAAAKEDKKSFVPLYFYGEIRRQIRDLAGGGALAEAGISLTRIEECSYDKVVLHLWSEKIKSFEDKKRHDLPWDAIEDLVGRIHALSFVEHFISIKQEAK